MSERAALFAFLRLGRARDKLALVADAVVKSAVSPLCELSARAASTLNVGGDDAFHTHIVSTGVFAFANKGRDLRDDAPRNCPVQANVKSVWSA